MEKQLQNIRDKLINAALSGLIILLIPLIIISISRTIETGWQWTYLIQFSISAAAFLIYLFRKQLSVSYKTHFLTILFILVCIVGTFKFGTSGGHYSCLIAVLIVTLIYGRRTGFMYFAIVLSGMILIGVLHILKIIPPEIDFNVYNYNITTWLTLIFALTYMMIIIIFSVGLFYDFFVENIKAITQKTNEQELVKANLEQNEKQLKQKNEEFAALNEKLTMLNDEYRLAKEIAENNHLQYKQLADSFTEVFFAMDNQLQYTFWNRASEQLTGIKSYDALGKHLFDIFPDTPQIRQAEKEYLDVVRTQQPKTFITKYDFGNDQIFYEISVYPTNNGISVFTKNITERFKTEQALKESEARFHIIADYSPDWEVFRNKKGELIYSSLSFEELTGFKNEDLISGKITMKDYVHPDDLEFALEVFSGAVRGDTITTEFRIITKDNQTKYITLSVRPVLVENNKFIGFRSSLKDITEQKQTELNLLKYQTAIESANASIVITDGEGNIEYANPFFTQLTGYAKEEYLGKNPRILKTNYFPTEYYKDLWDTIKAGKTWQGEFHNRKKNGELYWERTVISPIQNSRNEITNFVAIKTDITETIKMFDELFKSKEQLEKSQLQLKEQNEEYIALNKELTDLNVEFWHAKENAELSENHFKLLIDNVPEPIFIQSDYKFEYVNKATVILYGAESAEQLEGTHINNIIHPDYKELVIQRIIKMNENKIAGERIELKHLKLDNSVIDVEVTSVPFFYNNKNGALVFVHDITDRKIAELELIVAKEKAEESSRLKTAFLNNMTHEIRTPLNAIIGFTQMLKKPDLPDNKRNDFVSIVLNSSGQLQSIIEDLITISKLETNMEIVNIQQININAIILNLLDIYTPRSEKQNIALYSHHPLPDDKAEVMTDKIKLNEILSNLINNAIKFTQNGFVEFGYDIVATGSDLTVQLQFYVKDTGIGIDPKIREKIFERFVQADSGLSRRFGGTGLGLSISKGFVALLGGKIWVESEIDMGSTFYFTIPYKPINVL